MSKSAIVLDPEPFLCTSQSHNIVCLGSMFILSPHLVILPDSHFPTISSKNF